MVTDHIQAPAASTPGKSDPGYYRKRGSLHYEEEKNLLLLQESRLAHILTKGNEENVITRKHI
jgi:hypothetical protein